MSEWNRERTCRECDANFRLRDYGHTRAKAIAEKLEDGAGEEYLNDPESLVNRCPECSGRAVVGPNEQAAAKIFLEENGSSQEGINLPAWLRTIGVIGLVLSLTGLILVFLSTMVRGGKIYLFRGTPLLLEATAMLFVVLLVAGMTMREP